MPFKQYLSYLLALRQKVNTDCHPEGEIRQPSHRHEHESGLTTHRRWAMQHQSTQSPPLMVFVCLE